MVWEMQQFVTTFGQLFYAKREGTTQHPLLVFLSGMGDFNTQENYGKVIDLLDEEAPILTIDYVSSGKSGDATRHFIFMEEVQAIAKLIHQQQAKQVLLIAHSVGGIYAAELSPYVPNLIGFVGIEPSTREVFLQPPQTPAYLEVEAFYAGMEETEKEQWFYQKALDDLGIERTQQLFATAQLSSERDSASSDFYNQMISTYDLTAEPVHFAPNLPTILISQEYRKAEMARSEFMTPATASKVLTGGSYHYLQWECADLVAKAIKEVQKVSRENMQ